MRSFLLIAMLVAACGGGDSDPNAESNLVTCDAGWDTRIKDTALSGKCSASCQSLADEAPAGTTCSVAGDNGSAFDCTKFGGVVMAAGVCCLPFAHDASGSSWYVGERDCE